MIKRFYLLETKQRIIKNILFYSFNFFSYELLNDFSYLNQANSLKLCFLLLKQELVISVKNLRKKIVLMGSRCRGSFKKCIIIILCVATKSNF